MSTSAQAAPTASTTTTLSPQAQQIFNMAMPGLQSYAASTPQRYQGSTVAGFSPEQVTAQQSAMDAAQGQKQVADWATNMAQGFPGMLQGNKLSAYTPADLNLSSNIFSDPGIWNTAANPGLAAAINAAQRPTWENLTEQALPQIRNEAISHGPLGSREAIAEGIATGKATRAAGDIAAQMAQAEYANNLAAVNQRYGTNVNALLQNAAQGLTARGQDLTARGQDIGALQNVLGLAPTLSALQTAPAATQEAVGAAKQQMSQAELNDAINAYYFQQYAPYLQARDILGVAKGMPGATTTATGSVAQTDPWMQALGLGLQGAATAAAFM